jgi:hypothetical protein
VALVGLDGEASKVCNAKSLNQYELISGVVRFVFRDEPD